MAQLARFQKRINEVIPLTRALGVELHRYDGRRLVVTAPLALNHNHQGTGFGGSIYSVAVVAAWGLVELLLEDAGIEGRVVIQSGGVDYHNPVDDNFHAICELPPAADVERFLRGLGRRGKGRLELTSRVFCGPVESPQAVPVATFGGRFVVQVTGS